MLNLFLFIFRTTVVYQSWKHLAFELGRVWWKGMFKSLGNPLYSLTGCNNLIVTLKLIVIMKQTKIQKVRNY